MGLISLVFLAAAILFQFFIILSGGVSSMPEDMIYFLQADTAGIPNARNPSRWTFWSICGVDENGKNTDCGASVPALPFSPPSHSNFNTTSGVPDAFIGTKRYYLLSRFAWVFFLLALLFSAGAFLTGGLALCTRFGAYFSSMNTAIALFWQALAASLMTAWTVQAKKAWRNAGHDANLGKYAYGFTWAGVALLFLAMLSFGAAGGRSHHPATTTAAAGSGRRRGFWRRRRSVRKDYV